jgi:hypothetical protein
LEEYFGIDVKLKVIDVDFWILCIWFNLPILSSMSFMNFKIQNLIFLLELIRKKQSIGSFLVKFIGMDLKCDNLSVMIFLKFLCYLNV